MRILFAIAFCFFLFSCNNDLKTITLYSSHGGLDETVLVFDDALMDSEVMDTTNWYFSQDYLLLNAPQPTLLTRTRSYSDYMASAMLKKYRNVIFVGVGTKGISKQILDTIESKKNSLITDENFNYLALRDYTSTPQYAGFLWASDLNNLLLGLNKKGKKIVRNLTQHENKTHLYPKVYVQGRNQLLEEKIENELGVKMHVPKNYVLKTRKENFIHFGSMQEYMDKNGDIVGAIDKDFFITSLPYTDNKSILSFTTEYFKSRGMSPAPLIIRDSVTRLNVYGATINDHPYIELEYADVFQDSVKLAQFDALETRGLWKLDSPIRGGSFVNWLITNPAKNKIIVIDCYSFASMRDDKKSVLRELETIIETISEIN